MARSASKQPIKHQVPQRAVVKAHAAKQHAVKQLPATSGVNHSPKPALVLYGLEGDKPRAARFTESVAALATRAAGRMGLQVLDIKTAAQAEIASKLPAGRVYANGRGFVPFIRRDLFGQIREAAGSEPGSAAAKAVASDDAGGSSSDRVAPPFGVHQGYPPHWDAIEVGHLVIAHESPQDGWWEAIVVEKTGDMLTLRWRDYPKQPKVVRHRLSVALLCPNPT